MPNLTTFPNMDMQLEHLDKLISQGICCVEKGTKLHYFAAKAAFVARDWERAATEFQHALESYLCPGYAPDIQFIRWHLRMMIAGCEQRLGNSISGYITAKAVIDESQRTDREDAKVKIFRVLLDHFYKIAHESVAKIIKNYADISRLQNLQQIRVALLELEHIKAFFYNMEDPDDDYTTETVKKLRGKLQLKLKWLQLRTTFNSKMQPVTFDPLRMTETSDLNEFDFQARAWRIYEEFFSREEAELFNKFVNSIEETEARILANSIRGSLTCIEDSISAGNLPKALKILENTSNEAKLLARIVTGLGLSGYDGNEFNLEKYAASLAVLREQVALYHSRAAIGAENLFNGLELKDPVHKVHDKPIILSNADRDLIKQHFIKYAVSFWFKLDRRSDKTIQEISALLASKIRDQIRKCVAASMTLCFSGYTHYLDRSSNHPAQLCEDIRNCFTAYASEEKPDYILLPIFVDAYIPNAVAVQTEETAKVASKCVMLG